MISNRTLVLLLISMNSFPLVILVSIRELTHTDVYVDSNKGYVLRRVGTYVPVLMEQIIHSIIPLNSLCATEPNTNICSYNSQFKNTKIFELSSVLSSHDVVQTFSYDKDNISRSIGNDIIRVFSQHQPNQFFNKQYDVIHFTNNQFYHKNRNERSVQSTSENDVINNFLDIPHVRSTLTQQISHRINNQKIDLDYLSLDDQELFLSTISANLNTFHNFSNVQEVINIYTELTIGQSIHLLPYCSLAQEKSSYSQPCIVVSTLFMNVPIDSLSTYSVYRLIPLPTVFDHKKIMYSNLPEIIAINPSDSTLFAWDEEATVKKCMFSTIISCQQKPISVSLSKSSCLRQLLDERESGTSLCDVKRSDNIQHDVLRIIDNLWLFYNVQQITNCQIYSNFNTLPELLSIKEAALISLPCDKTMTCMDFQIPATSCKKDYIVRTSTFSFTMKNLSRSVISTINMTDTILAAYISQFNKSVNELKTVFKTNQSTGYQTIADLAIYIITFISFIIIIAFFRCLTIMKFKLEKEMKTLLRQLRKLLNIDDTAADFSIDSEA